MYDVTPIAKTSRHLPIRHANCDLPFWTTILKSTVPTLYPSWGCHNRRSRWKWRQDGIWVVWCDSSSTHRRRIWFYSVIVDETDFQDLPVVPNKWQNVTKPHTWRIWTNTFCTLDTSICSILEHMLQCIASLLRNIYIGIAEILYIIKAVYRGGISPLPVTTKHVLYTLHIL